MNIDTALIYSIVNKCLLVSYTVVIALRLFKAVFVMIALGMEKRRVKVTVCVLKVHMCGAQ